MNDQNKALERAQANLDQYVQRGKMQGLSLFESIKNNVITPYRVYTRDMSFMPGELTGSTPRYAINMAEDVRHLTLHRHALSQMAAEVKIPMTFVNTLTEGEDWERRELSDLLHERFSKLDFKQRGGGSPRFINLVVGNEVRGFVSRSFKRYLKSGPIFEAFVKACAAHALVPVQALTSDLRLTLRCVLPTAFEVTRGEHVAVGISCSNSDFGAGPMKLSLNIMNLETSVITVLKSLKEERHVGAAEKDQGTSDMLSDETIEKRISAVQSEIRDVVTAAVHPDQVDELLDMVRRAKSKELSWSRFVSYMQGTLTSEEIKEVETLLKDRKKSEEIADIAYDVDNQAIINLWWASNAVSSIAARHDPDKQDEIQTLAGKILASA